MGTPSAATGLHFLPIPYTAHGHITPMLSLASQLAALQCKVTFLCPTPKGPDCRVDDDLAGHSHSADNSFQVKNAPNEVEDAHPTNSAGGHSSFQVQNPPKAVKDAHSDLLHFVAISDARSHHKPLTSAPIDQAASMTAVNPKLKSALIQLEEQQALVERIVQESKASPLPISSIICDLTIWKWVKKIASTKGLHLSILAPCSALTVYSFSLRGAGRALELEPLLVSGFGMARDGDASHYGLANIREEPAATDQKMKFLYSLLEGIEDANVDILVNSFKRLEAPLLPALESSGLKVRFIGPCFPTWEEAVSSQMAQKAGSAFLEEEACLPWLDRQEDRSVLFVSFGSEGTLQKEDVEEITMGVELSGSKFLRVMRPDAPASSWPAEEFRRRNSCRPTSRGVGGIDQYERQRRGMFVPWVPQRRVLQHRAVGGFLTHNGWNSTIESVAFGVPMVCLPLMADQPINGNLVDRHWRVGMRLPMRGAIKGSGNIVPVVQREEVERGVRAVMEGRFCDQVLELQQAAYLAATQDVPHSLASFLADARKYILSS